MTKTNYHDFCYYLFLLSLIILHGCSSVPQTPTGGLLQAAQTAYQAAQSNPLIAKYATVELATAEQTLRQAEAAKDPAQQSHLAYLAQKRAQLAVAVAERKAAETERDQLLKQRGAKAATPPQFCAATNIQRLAEVGNNVKPKQTAHGWLFILEDQQFDSKTELVATAIDSLNQLISFLKQHPNQKVIIDGYAKSSANREHNLGVSQRQAEAIRLAMVNCGIASNRILAKGRGDNVATANTRAPTGRQANLRVEILILNEGESLPY